MIAKHTHTLAHTQRKITYEKNTNANVVVVENTLIHHGQHTDHTWECKQKTDRVT